MCWIGLPALSWVHNPSHHSYHLFFNRDEQRNREPATPPEIDRSDPISFITARDGRAGGTWLLTNDRGLSIAILNHYDADAPAIEHAESRGLLVTSLAQCQTINEFRDRLTTLKASGHYRPFLLIAISQNSDASLWRWDGKHCSEQPIPNPAFITTSSFQSEKVIRHRTQLRQKLPDPAQPNDLRKMHAHHDPALPTHSIRMRRPDAMTVSLCELHVTPDSACYRYHAESEDSLPTELRLPLVTTDP